EALQEHTPQVGAGWNPEASPSLWSYLGIDDGQTAPGGTAGASGTGGLSGTPSATVGADAARVMGFESPESDWNTASPGVVSRETNVVHGTSSLGVTGATWSRLESVPIPWTGVPAVTTVGFDVFVPAPTNQPGWW